MINVSEYPVLLMSSWIFSHDIVPGAPVIGLLLVGGGEQAQRSFRNSTIGSGVGEGPNLVSSNKGFKPVRQ